MTHIKQDILTALQEKLDKLEAKLFQIQLENDVLKKDNDHLKQENAHLKEEIKGADIMTGVAFTRINNLEQHARKDSVWS